MGKRTKDKSDEEIRSKIKRLEKELNSRQKPPDKYRNEDRESYDSYYDHEEMDFDTHNGSDNDVISEEETAFECRRAESVVEMPVPAYHSPSPPSPAPKNAVEDPHSDSTMAQSDENAIPSEILAVLGEAKKAEETFGKKIPVEVSERWGKILTGGLIKEQKEMLLTKILIPENFQLAKAPKLNAEVASVLTEATKNRDKRLEKMLNQLGLGIAGLANLTSELINKDLIKMDIIKQISEINQILLDLHYEETMNRRRLLIPLLSKSFINIIQGVKREKFLFGDNLGDNIKTTKSIERSSLQIKKPMPPPQSSAYNRKPSTTTAPQGNSRAPPRQPSGQGAARAPPFHARPYPPQPTQPPGRRPPPGPRRPPPPPPASRPQDRRSRHY